MSFKSSLFVLNRIEIQYFSLNTIVPLKANYRNSAFLEFIEPSFSFQKKKKEKEIYLNTSSDFSLHKSV